QPQFDDWVAQVRQSPDQLSFDEFKRLAAPTRKEPVRHFASVEPLLFKKVIDQFIGVGENTAATSGHNAEPKASQE
ncbi:MAG: COX aromatic rich motif-containing protein, partial [Comamonas sp.]